MNQDKNKPHLPAQLLIVSRPALSLRTGVRAGGAFNCQPPGCRGCISAEAHQDCRAAVQPPHAT